MDADDVNVPRYLNVEVGSDRREIIFLAFVTTEPPAADFIVPKECEE